MPDEHGVQKMACGPPSSCRIQLTELSQHPEHCSLLRTIFQHRFRRPQRVWLRHWWALQSIPRPEVRFDHTYITATPHSLGRFINRSHSHSRRPGARFTLVERQHSHNLYRRFAPRRKLFLRALNQRGRDRRGCGRRVGSSRSWRDRDILYFSTEQKQQRRGRAAAITTAATGAAHGL
jgi:hypothetical protein